MDEVLKRALSDYAVAAHAQSARSVEGDAARANAHYEELRNALLTISQYGEEGVEAMLTLLSSGSPDVKGWAATHLLSKKPREAVSALEELARGSGIIAFEARMTLQEWRENPSRFAANWPSVKRGQ